MDLRNVKDLGNKFLVGFLVFILGLILIGVVFTSTSFGDMDASSLSKTEQAAAILTSIQPLKLEFDSNTIEIARLQDRSNVLIKDINEKNASYNSLMGL